MRRALEEMNPVVTPVADGAAGDVNMAKSMNRLGDILERSAPAAQKEKPKVCFELVTSPRNFPCYLCCR